MLPGEEHALHRRWGQGEQQWRCNRCEGLRLLSRVQLKVQEKSVLYTHAAGTQQANKL
jgi:hypothetical protein